MDVKAADLARELGVSVSVLLMEADALIQRTYEKGSYAAVEGMTTRTVRQGKVTGVTVSPKLAEALRELHPGRTSG